MPQSLLDPREVNRARSGPRQLKDPRSRAYAIQTVHALKRYLESQRLDEDLVRKELAEIDQYRHWEVLGYPSREALLEAEVGDSSAGIEAKLGRHGGDHKSERAKNQHNNIMLKRQGTDPAYLLARLDRDQPALALRVRSGELTAHAAAREAGIVKPVSAYQQLARAWIRATEEERAAFLAWVDAGRTP